MILASGLARGRLDAYYITCGILLINSCMGTALEKDADDLQWLSNVNILRCGFNIYSLYIPRTQADSENFLQLIPPCAQRCII